MFVGTRTLGSRPAAVIQHAGNTKGVATGFWRMPEEDRAIIVVDSGMSAKLPALTAGIAELLNADDR